MSALIKTHEPMTFASCWEKPL